MSVETKNTTVQITAADIAEESLALNAFYRDRALAVQSMRRTEAEKVEILTDQLKEALERLAALENARPGED